MIDLDVLDDLARDHLQFEVNCTNALRADADKEFTSDSAIVCALYRIRNLVMEGRIDDALLICESISSHMVEDPRLQLDIRVHKLYELIYAAENLRSKGALVYGRAVEIALHNAQELAQYSLNAFPEAYEIFREAMILFALPEQIAAPEAMHQKRQSIANDLVSLVRYTICARESCLSFLIRYLMLIYVQFKSPTVPNHSNELNAVDALIAQILHCNSDSSSETNVSRITWRVEEPRPPQSNSPKSFEEADIQALRERACISRQESIEGLSFAKGDLFTAMKNELGRVQLDRKRFRRMVLEYCAARGLEVFSFSDSSQVYPLSPQFPAVVEGSQKRLLISNDAFSSSYIEMFEVMRSVRILAVDEPKESILERLSKIEFLLSKPSKQSVSLKFRIAQRKALFHLYRREYETVMRISQAKLGPLANLDADLLPSLTDTMTLLACAEEGNSLIFNEEYESEKSCPARSQRGKPQDQCSSSKKPEEERRNSISPNKGTSIQVAQIDQSSFSFEEMLTSCKESVVASCSYNSFIEEAYCVLENTYGEPDMIRLLKKLLAVYEEWQTQNMMKDHLSHAFGVDEVLGLVKGGGTCVSTVASVKESENRSGQHGNSSNAIQGRGDSAEQREQRILVLMEVMNMTRAEAIAVLRNYPESVTTQAILDSLFTL